MSTPRIPGGVGHQLHCPDCGRYKPMNGDCGCPPRHLLPDRVPIVCHGVPATATPVWKPGTSAERVQPGARTSRGILEYIDWTCDDCGHIFPNGIVT